MILEKTKDYFMDLDSKFTLIPLSYDKLFKSVFKFVPERNRHSVCRRVCKLLYGLLLRSSGVDFLLREKDKKERGVWSRAWDRRSGTCGLSVKRLFAHSDVFQSFSLGAKYHHRHGDGKECKCRRSAYVCRFARSAV